MRASRTLFDALSASLTGGRSNSTRAPCSRRHARQMERRFGPAWHHVVDLSNTAATVSQRRSIPKAAGSDIPRGSVGTSSLELSKNAEIGARAVELGLISEEREISLPSTTVGEVDSSVKDPLLEFLERNEEEAALLLAMWTSLRRSCLHASEISESLSLRVRWFFHHLIRMRAIGAAVRFYHRLLTLGVQLQKWDVLVLLSNLPYERSTTVSESQSSAWMQEKHLSQWAETQLRERRKRGETVNSIQKKRVNTVDCGNASMKQEKPHVMVDVAGVSPITAELSQLKSSGRWEDSLSETMGQADKNCSQVVKTSLSQQPDWIRRWFLYEASMGNIEFHDADVKMPLTHAENGNEFHLNDSLDVDENMLQESLEANRIMSVTAHLKHLMLLQDAWNLVKPNTSKKQQLRGGSSFSMRQRRYWAEALHMAHTCMESMSALKRITTLPDEVLDIMRRAVMSSQSWKVSFRFTEAAEHYGVTLNKRDYVNFMRLAVEEEPWRNNSSVERFMVYHVLPHFSDANAIDYVVRAVWLTYFCSLKLDRPERCMELMGDHTKNLPETIKEAIMLAKLAVSHLHIEADRYRSEFAARQVLATSLRLGLFSSAGGDESSEDNSSRSLLEMTYPRVSGSSNTATATTTLLSEDLRNSFMLLCISLPRVFALAPILVVSKEDAVQFSFFLADAFYGRVGIWGIFSKLYLDKSNVSVRQAPERPLIAAFMALCIIRITLSLCIAHGEFSSRQRGVVLLTPKQLILFLGMEVESLSNIPSHAFGGGTELDSVIMLLQQNASRLTREVCRFFNLTPSSERLWFGSTSEETIESLTLMVRILLLLHTPWPRRKFPVGTQLLLRSLLQPSSGLGKRIRYSLRHKEAEDLDNFLYNCRGHNGRGKGRGGRGSNNSSNEDNVSSSSRRLRNFSPEDVARIDASAKMHSLIYSIALDHENNVSAVEDTLISRLKTMRSDDAFLLSQIALHHLRFSPGTLGQPFFIKVLERLRAGVMSEENEKSLWFKAVNVFWDAVDHTACTSYSCVEVSGVNNNQISQKHEKNVFSSLLLPLMQFSVATKRRDLGWVWLNRWVSLHTVEERDTTSWAILHIQARSALRDKRALHMCLKLIVDEQKKKPAFCMMELPSAPLTSLLCEVTVGHADWQAALENLLQPFVCSLKDKKASSPLPVIVAISVLRILCRAPVNLSNTALQLRAVQGDEWNIQSSNGLLLLLVRQRRWRLALQHVTEMIPVLDKAINTIGEKEEEKEAKMNEMFFLLYGLRACAIGGCGEEAALLYDRVKALNTDTPISSSTLDKVATNNHSRNLEELLFSSCDTHGIATCISPEGDLNEDMRAIIASQARRYFLRAMTKKSLVLQGSIK